MSESLADRANRRTGMAGPLPGERPVNPGLPPVWWGRRRRHLTLLTLAGSGQAAAAALSARLVSNALAPSGVDGRGPLLSLLVAVALTVGLLRMAERVLAERLGQDYVHEIRLGLIRRTLLDGGAGSPGVAVARSTTVLAVVKSWISQGVASLAVGIPLIIGVGVALMLLDPWLLVALVVPVAVLLLSVRVLAPAAYRRTRRVRRVRGRLSAQVADTVLSAAAIRSAGGSGRELSRIDRHGQALVAAVMERVTVTGAMRGVSAAMSGIAMALVIWAGLLAGLPTYSIAGTLTMMGFLVIPLHDLGGVVEYRQAYCAARRVLGPDISGGGDPDPRRAEPAQVSSGFAGGTVIAAFVELSDGTTMPQLATQSGARVVLDTGSERLTSEVLEQFVGLRTGYAGSIVVSGRDLSVAEPTDLRRLVGYASRGMMLVRGTVSRTIRYGAPDIGPEEVSRLLEEVDLADRLAELADGADTILVHGGEPLTIPERARLLLARAILGNPPLLVFDHLDAELGRIGRGTMRRLLAGYPGVVILASDDPDQIVTPTHLWRPDGVHRIGPGQPAGQPGTAC